MTDFREQLISNTYRSVLAINASTTGSGVTTSLAPIQSGDGTNTAIKIATNSVQINTLLRVSGQVCASTYYGDGSNLSGVGVTGSISVGNTFIDGVVTVTGNAVFEADVSVSGDLNVATNASVGGTLINTGAATFSSTVTVVGAGTFKDDVSVLSLIHI